MNKDQYIGRRVRLTEKYAQYIKQKSDDGDCRTGVITKTTSGRDGDILIVDLDNGNSCMPYSWDHTNLQCELIPEQSLKITELKGSKVAIQCKTEEEWDQITELAEYKWHPSGKANSISEWKIEVKKVDVGCCKEITIAQLQEVQKEYNYING